MKRFLLLIPLLAALGGCTTFNPFIQRVETAIKVVTSASVTPQQIIIAGNAFDAGEASATQYLLFCRANVGNAGCALSTRKKIVAAVRSGRKARDTLEPYAVAGNAGPVAIYNTLIAAITTLQSNLPAAGAAK